MIPDFKTYLKESVWGDLRKKSLGQEDRVESGVDNLGLEEFYEYLKCRYVTLGDEDITYSDKVDTIKIPILHGYAYNDIYVRAKNYLLAITMKRDDMRPWFLEKLRERYNVSFDEIEKDWWDVCVTPKGGDASLLPNSFFIEVIDYIIDMEDDMDKVTGNLKHLELLLKKNVNESVWGDLRKKSLGQELRDENIVQLDNLNEGTMEDLYNYVIQNYEYTVEPVSEYRTIRLMGNDLFVPINLKGGVLNTSIDSDNPDNIEFLVVNSNLVKYLTDEAYQEYFDYTEKDDPHDEVTKIIVDVDYFPKRNFIGILDCLLEHVPYPALRKKEPIKESVWGDIRKKSLGQEERGENIVSYEALKDFKAVELLYKYLIQNYECLGDKEIVFHNEKIDKKVLPWVEIPVTLDGDDIYTQCDEDDPGQIWGIAFSKYLKEYVEKMHVEEIDDEEIEDDPNTTNIGGYLIAYPSSSPVMCSEVVDFLDELLALVPDPALRKKEPIKESVWGDIRKKSLGQEERGEDKITMANLDYSGIDGLLKYLEQNYEQCGKFGIENHNKDYGYILIPVIDGSELYFSNIIQVMTYMRNPDKIVQVDIPSWFRFRLTDNYYVNKKRGSDSQYYVNSREHPDYVSNTEVIDILDTLLQGVKTPALKKKEPIKESVWGELRKKSLGQEVREEDNVENLDGDGLREYIEERYEYIDNNDPKFYGFLSKQHYVEVPLLKYGHAPYKIFLEQNADSGRWLSISPYKGKYIMFPYVAPRKNGKYIEPGIYNKLREEYDTEEVYDMQGFERIIHFLSIRPKDGSEITNQFFLDVIDFALENMTDPLKPTIKKL